MRQLTIACAVLFLACSTDPTIPSGPASIEAVGSFAGTPGWQLEEPLAVLVKDAAGHPVEGARVTWSSSEEGAWLEGETSETDAEGLATMAFAPGWRLGSQRVDVTTAGLSAQLSIGTTGLTLTMTAATSIPGSGIRFCGIDAAGALWCWLQGVIESPRHPPPQLTDASVPVRVDAGTDYVQLIGDGLMLSAPMCGLTEAGVLRCWDPESLAPTTTVTPVPFERVALTVWPSMALCGLDAESQAWCRGDNTRGQLGDGTTIDRQAFAPVTGAMRFRSLSSGYAAFCGLDAEHHAWCWGDGYTLVGFGAPSVLEPIRFGDEHQFVDLGFIYGGACGLGLGGGPLACWGASRMGDGPLPEGGTFQVAVPSGLVEISGRHDLGLFRTSSGQLLMAGDMAHDPGVNAFVRTPQAIEGMPPGVSALLSDGGNAWCVATASGATICGSRIRRPVGVPAPR